MRSLHLQKSMFRLVASRGGGLTLAGMSLLNNESGKGKSGDDVQNGDSFNTRSWWDTFKDKLHFGGLGGSTSSQTEKKEVHSETYRKMKKEIDDNITPWDRVKLIFYTSGHQARSPELDFVAGGVETGFLIGFLYGGGREAAKKSYLFLYCNDANKYLNMNEAKAALSKAGLKAFFKGGLETSPKCGILTGIFLAVSTVVSAYRGKSGILEYGCAGAATTAAMKFNLGIRGMISGCVSGGLSGLALGSIFYIITSVSKTNFFDARYYAYLKSKREECLAPKEEEKDFFSPVQEYHFKRTKDFPDGFPD